MNKILILLVCAVYINSLQAKTLVGEGYGDTRQEARKNALAALSESLYVDIKADYESETASNGYNNATLKVHTSSDLPLLGVDYTVVDKKKDFYCTATLESSRVLPLYQSELQKLRVSINSLNAKRKSASNASDKYRVLNELLGNILQFEKLESVSMMLGGKIEQSSTDAASIRSEILGIESISPTLDIAADVLTRNLPQGEYMVQAPLPAGSNQVTAFSRVMRDKVMDHIHSVSQRHEYTSFLKGRYEIQKQGIVVSYQAVDYKGETLASRVVKISPGAYQGLGYKPDSVNFEKLLNDGYVRSNDFRADLNTNQGSQSLLFQPGQTIELFARLNEPGYFYIVSHNISTEQSYLLELNDASGKRAFIRYVNADDANRWLSLGQFEVSPPYGTENLQMIASSQDLINKLPVTALDESTGLYIIQAKNVEDAVIKTRGLTPVHKKSVRSAETTLSFTTMAK